MTVNSIHQHFTQAGFGRVFAASVLQIIKIDDNNHSLSSKHVSIGKLLLPRPAP